MPEKLPWDDRVLCQLVRRPLLYRFVAVALGVSAVFCGVWPFVELHNPYSVMLFPLGVICAEACACIGRSRRRYLAWLEVMVRTYVRPVRGRR